MAIPVTFTAGNVLEANQLNSNFSSVYADYVAYTPVVTGWTQGNGTFSAQSATVGDMVQCYGYFVFGSTSAVTASGLKISLPVNVKYFDTVGNVYWKDISGGVTVMGACIAETASTMSMFWLDPETVPLAVRLENWVSGGPTMPFTFATGDYVFWTITYEKA